MMAVRRPARRRVAPALLYLALGLGSLLILVPFWWMLAASLQTRDVAGEYPPRWLPQSDKRFVRHDARRDEVILLSAEGTASLRVRFRDGREAVVPSRSVQVERSLEPRWENYLRILRPKRDPADDDFPRYLLNTLVIVALCVLGQVLSSSVVGWGFARLRFAGRELLFMVMLATVMVPAQIAMIPTFILFRWLGWIDTFLPLIVPAWLGSAFFAFLYRQFFMGIPVEMDEAASMDGCSPFRCFWHVLLPLATPVTVTTAVFTFIGTWNEFLAPLIYINSDQKRTLSLALAKFQSAYATDVPALMAAAILMLLPVVAVYFFSQRALLRGMVVTGVKG